ncbi:MAG TPA: hypothetical protein VFW70_04480 [Methylomirabilota bacterium]|nr:hypothetical protein [Methylomirabilota bacterium]
MPQGDGVCSFHFYREHEWATGNRIMCDFLHRGIVPPASPPTADDREAFVEAGEEALDGAVAH